MLYFLTETNFVCGLQRWYFILLSMNLTVVILKTFFSFEIASIFTGLDGYIPLLWTCDQWPVTNVPLSKYPIQEQI